MTKWVYMFSEGDAGMRNLLGGKGANLAEMTRLGLPVPQGFTITTEACTRYYEDDCQISDEIKAQIDGAVTKLEKIFENDPFAKLDQKGVGELMKLAARLGKGANKKLHTGVCGEHGGDPSSVEFCHSIGLDYVSCSPLRVPIARLAAAQAAINNTK